MEAKFERMMERILAAQAAKFEEQLRQVEARHQEELKRLREEKDHNASVHTDSGDVKSLAKKWEGYVSTLNHHGYDFDERDIASLSLEYREMKNIMPRFCDGNEVTRPSNSHLINMVNTLKEKGCSDDLIKTAVVMYINRHYALVKSFTKGGYYYKSNSQATNKEDREAGVKVVRYVPKVKSSVVDLLSFNIFIGGRAIKASTIWNDSPYKLTFETVGINCGEPIYDMLNLFTPHPYFLELKKASKEELKALAREAKAWEGLLRDLTGDKAAYDYIYNWLAHLVQFPGVKMGVALGMYGPKGIGKNTLLRPLQKLFGRHYLETSKGDNDVFGEFTELLNDKLVVTCNEAFFGGNKEKMGVIKHLITEDTIVINTKGVSKYIQENVLNLIIMSNNDRIVPAEEDERRYAIFQLKGRYSGASTPEKERYFSRIKAVPVKAVLAALLLRDLSNWNPREIPKTDALRHQQSQGLNTCYAFWEQAMKREDESFGKVYLSDEELLKYNLAHKKPKAGMGFDDSLASELVPGIKPGLRSADSEENYGIPRVEVRMGGKTNEATLYWSYIDEDGKLKRCSLQKELVFKIFDQWQYKNRPKHLITSDRFWKLTPHVIQLTSYRPRDHGESKRPVEIILPTQQEARDYFAKVFMKDEGYFHTYEYELMERQIVEEYEYHAEKLKGEDRKKLDEWFKTQMKELKEKYGRLEADEWDADEEKKQPPPLPSTAPPPLPSRAPPPLPSTAPPPLPSTAPDPEPQERRSKYVFVKRGERTQG